MKTQLRKNFGFSKLSLTLLFSFSTLIILLYSLSREMKAESGALSPKASEEWNPPCLLDYQTGVSTCEQTENLVSNPGFEQGIGCHNQWCCGDCGGICTCEEYYPGHSSNIAAWIFAGYTRTESCALFTPSTDMIPVESGRSYDYSAWIKADLLQGSAYLRITLWSPDWEWKGEARTTSVTGTRDWVKVAGSVQVPTDAEYARVECTVSDLGKGSVWFDDIFLGLATCLEISKSGDPDPVEPGQMLTYTIVYGNTGREKATGVEILENYDKYVDFESAQPPPFTGTTTKWTTPTLPAGVSDTITVVVKVENDTEERKWLFNSVQILSDETLEPIYTTISTSVDGNGCDMALYLPDDKNPGKPGHPTNYNLTLENAGACGGQADLAAASSQGWEVIITPPPPYTLPSGNSREVTVSPVVTQCELSGTVDVTTITVTLDCDAPCDKTVTETTAVTTTVAGVFGVEIGLPLSKTVLPGDTVLLTHTVSNTGNYTDTFSFAVYSEQGWDLSLPSTVTLGPCGLTDQSTEITLNVTVPCTADPGIQDTIIVTVTSQSNPSAQYSVEDRIVVDLWRIYSPLVAKCYCAPNEIANNCFVSPCDFAPWWGEEGALRRKVVRAEEDAYNPFGCCSARLGDPAYDNNSGEIPVNDRATIYQTVTVPDTSSPRLVFIYEVYSYHIMRGGVTGRLFDSFEVAIDEPSNFIFRTGNPEGMVPNDCRHTVWQSGVQSESLDLTPYAGKTITIYFSVWNRIHGGCNTWAYIDNVQIVP